MAGFREAVVPGEKIDSKKGRKLGNGVYQEGELVLSRVMGIPRITEDEMSVVPLSGVYLPNLGDKVIGIISEVEISGWLVDINSPYAAFLPIAEAVDEFIDMARTDISRYFDGDDIIFCRVSKVTKNKTVQVSLKDPLSRKLHSGIIIKVTPSKIPRIIGKAGSMISLIKDKTKCDIYTGQNGVIWIRGEDKAKAIEAILTIEKESHSIGLTEKIEGMFK